MSRQQCGGGKKQRRTGGGKPVSGSHKPEALEICVGVVAGVRIGKPWCRKHCGQHIFGGSLLLRVWCSSSLSARKKKNPAAFTNTGTTEEQEGGWGAVDKEVNLTYVNLWGWMGGEHQKCECET